MSCSRLAPRFVTCAILIVLALVSARSLTSRAADPGPNDAISTEINTVVTFEALANDPNVDHFGMVNQPAHGQTWSVGNGTISYFPAANYVGFDAFSYAAFDSAGVEYTATVTVTVNGSPTAVATRAGATGARPGARAAGATGARTAAGDRGAGRAVRVGAAHVLDRVFGVDVEFA